jgi:hypothetical protein
MFVVIAAVHGLSAFTKDATFLIAGERLTFRIRTLVFASILRQDVCFFDSAVCPPHSILVVAFQPASYTDAACVLCQ